MTETEFINQLKEHGIELSTEQIGQFKTYFEMLVEWNQKINLTAVTEMKEVYLKHFYDSITPLLYAEIEEGASLCDVGAGAGFPSIPMKIIRPDRKSTRLNSSHVAISYAVFCLKKKR